MVTRQEKIDAMLFSLGYKGGVNEDIAVVKKHVETMIGRNLESWHDLTPMEVEAITIERCATCSSPALSKGLGGVPHFCDVCRIKHELSRANARISLLEKRLKDEERSHENTLRDRDRAMEYADALAYAIAGEEIIGEHSNMNDPWKNALEEIESLHSELAALKQYKEGSDGLS